MAKYLNMVCYGGGGGGGTCLFFCVMQIRGNDPSLGSAYLITTQVKSSVEATMYPSVESTKRGAQERLNSAVSSVQHQITTLR